MSAFREGAILSLEGGEYDIICAIREGRALSRPFSAEHGLPLPFYWFSAMTEHGPPLPFDD